MPSINQRLREIRKRARPAISGPEMAEALGFESRQAYYHYESENGFKGRWLPMDLARSIAAILADHGINPDDVMALAGVEADEIGPHGLTAGEEQLLDHFRHLDPDQRTLLLQMAQQMERRPGGPAPATVHGPKQRYRAPEAVAR